MQIKIRGKIVVVPRVEATLLSFYYSFFFNSSCMQVLLPAQQSGHANLKFDSAF